MLSTCPSQKEADHTVQAADLGILDLVLLLVTFLYIFFKLLLLPINNIEDKDVSEDVAVKELWN